MAKNYVDNLSEETRKGMQEKAEQGIWPSFAPLGYRNSVRSDGKRVIEPDPDTAPIIAQMFDWYCDGDQSLRQLSKRAREAGLRFRKSASAVPLTSVQHILKNPIYMGEFDWKGRRYSGVHEPVVARSCGNGLRPFRGPVPRVRFAARGPSSPIGGSWNAGTAVARSSARSRRDATSIIDRHAIRGGVQVPAASLTFARSASTRSSKA